MISHIWYLCIRNWYHWQWGLCGSTSSAANDLTDNRCLTEHSGFWSICCELYVISMNSAPFAILTIDSASLHSDNAHGKVNAPSLLLAGACERQLQLLFWIPNWCRTTAHAIINDLRAMGKLLSTDICCWWGKWYRDLTSWMVFADNGCWQYLNRATIKLMTSDAYLLDLCILLWRGAGSSVMALLAWLASDSGSWLASWRMTASGSSLILDWLDAHMTMRLSLARDMIDWLWLGTYFSDSFQWLGSQHTRLLSAPSLQLSCLLSSRLALRPSQASNRHPLAVRAPD